MTLWGVITMFMPAGAFAYEMGDVTDGGTITGSVTLNGPAPEPRAFPIVIYQYGDFCKKISDGNGRILLKEFNVDPGGGLQDAVVVVQNVKKGKGFRYTKNEFITTNCMFHPYNVPEDEQFEVQNGHVRHVHPLVMIMRNNQQVSVQNRDPIAHNGQVYQPEKGNQVLNFPIPVSDKIHGGFVHIEGGKKIVQMICGMHEYMQSWGWVVDNPYYEKTKKNGLFTIDRLPPGTYRVTAWHPHLKPIEKEITMTPNGSVSLDFEFDAREVIRPFYETQREFRMGPGYHQPFHEPEDVLGCEGPFCVHDHD
ncbi:MAG: carboxypeptidase regulatory-like domain-containing protein [Nitrospirae bacterium]|nr:carboxypeptidase regulatory-like domain-containing protein [Nitrospirota bacterium]